MQNVIYMEDGEIAVISKNSAELFNKNGEKDTKPLIISFYTYNDYKLACEYLGIDLSLDKNRYPHDFKRWHDIRIDEYATLKAELDAVKRKELYEKFAKVAEKYLPLQRLMKEGYVCILAKSPAELIREGDYLNHCVGKYGYDQKFTREESLIFFSMRSMYLLSQPKTKRYTIGPRTNTRQDLRLLRT